MRQIIAYMRSFYRETYNPVFYLLFFFLLLSAVFANYTFNLDKKLIAYFSTHFQYFLYKVFFYGFSYYGAAILYAFTTGKKQFLFKPDFWIKSLLAIILLSLAAAFTYVGGTYIIQNIEYTKTYFLRKLLFNTSRWLWVFLPMLAYYFFIDRSRNKNGFYGLFVTKHFSLRPYMVMLAIMLVPIIWASFQPSFLNAYPTYKAGLIEEAHNIPKWQTITLYETFYALDFITVELVFRGFLVIGMVRIFGTAAIWPMVSFYAFLHFGKPMAECLGSIGGGLVLGIIAYYSRSILGGVIVHVGVAMLMEFAALAQLYFLNKG